MRDSQGVGREEMNREREGEPRERRSEESMGGKHHSRKT